MTVVCRVGNTGYKGLAEAQVTRAALVLDSLPVSRTHTHIYDTQFADKISYAKLHTQFYA